MSHPGKKKPASPGDKFYFIHDPWQMDVLLLAHQLEGSVLMSSSWRWLLYVYDIGIICDLVERQVHHGDASPEQKDSSGRI